ncbi:MAG: hypothetical protein M1836_005881 [Candelina mexicana]|nr:MAG: hypothetical protein M1836_005881 [Candelina mexicana]
MHDMHAEILEKRDRLHPEPKNSFATSTSPEKLMAMRSKAYRERKEYTRDDPKLAAFFRDAEMVQKAAEEAMDSPTMAEFKHPKATAPAKYPRTLGKHNTRRAVNAPSDEEPINSLIDPLNCKNSFCINGNIPSKHRGKPEGVLGLCYWNTEHTRSCPGSVPKLGKSVRPEGSADGNQEARAGNGNAARNSDVVPMAHWKTVARLEGLPTSPDQSSFGSCEELVSKKQKRNDVSPGGSKRSASSFRSIRDGLRRPAEVIKKGAAALGGAFHRKDKHPKGQAFVCNPNIHVGKPAKPTKIPVPVESPSTKRSSGAAKKGMTFRGQVENYK